MTKDQILLLVESYFDTIEKNRKLSNFLQDYMDGYPIIDSTPLESAVYDILTIELGKHWFEMISEFYDRGYGFYADMKDQVESGYLEPIDEDTYKVHPDKFKKLKKYKSYQEFHTLEDWMLHNRELLDS